MIKTTLLAAVLTAAFSFGSTVPVDIPDSVTVTGPGIGRAVVPFSGQTWKVCGNDNFGDPVPGGDNDFNEPCGLANFGTGGTFSFQLLFSVSAYVNYLGVQGQPGSIGIGSPSATFSYTPGVEVVFDQFVETLGVHLYSGSGSRNADGIAYVWAACTVACGTIEEQSADTVEPSAFLLLTSALALLQLRRVLGVI